MVAPDECALVVVDVQNDYCADAGTFGRAGHDLRAIQAAVERIDALVRAARRARVPVVWVRTHHDRWTDSAAWLGRAPRAAGAICATGSWGAEPYRLAAEGDDCVVIKHRYSAFVGSRLEVVLRTLARPVLIFAGVTTNVCVESTARDAFMRDWQVVLVEDGAAALTKAEHEGAVHNIRTYFGRVTDTASLEARWLGA